MSTGALTAGSSEDGRQRPGFIGLWLTISPMLAIASVFVYAVAGNFAQGSTFWSVFGVGFITAAASFIAGAFLGFLFALPRTLEQAQTSALLATNSNLDQVSDWLTKILVGVGLVEIAKIGKGIDGMAASLVPGLGGKPSAHAFAFGLLAYSAIDGFLVSYLWTRIVASIRLNEAAEALARRRESLIRTDALTEAVLSAPLPPPPPLPLRPPTPDATSGPATDTGGLGSPGPDVASGEGSASGDAP